MTAFPGPLLADRLKADLVQAMKARDRAAVTALRTALAALANAEAPDFDGAVHREGRGELLEHARLTLGAEGEQAVLVAEVRRREALIAEHGGRGLDPSYLDDLRAELAVLRRYLV